MSNFLVSLDASFTRTGICIIDLVNRTICFETASCKIGEKQFENVFKAAKSIVKQIKEIITKYCGNDFDLVIESPLPCSSMSPALYALDTLIVNEFESHIKTTYNPRTLASKIHGHKYSKTDSQELANKYINILSSNMYTIISVMGTKRKIVHDCAESFLYSHLYLKNSGHPDFQFDNSDDKLAYKERMKELKKRERLLLKQELIVPTQGD